MIEHNDKSEPVDLVHISIPMMAEFIVIVLFVGTLAVWAAIGSGA